MKSKSFHQIFVLVLFILLFSCDTQENLQPMTKEKLTTTVLSSSQFKDLGIFKGNLEITSSQFANDLKTAISIPITGTEGKEGIVALFTEDYKIRSVVYFALKAQINTDQLREKMLNGTFDGDLQFKSVNYDATFTLQNSKITNKKLSEQSRVSTCGPATVPGGAFDCAGRNITEMGPFAKAACYINFITCLAIEVADCYATGCEQ